MGRRPRIRTQEELDQIKRNIEAIDKRREARKLKQELNWNRNRHSNYPIFINHTFNCEFVPFRFNYLLGYCE